MTTQKAKRQRLHLPNLDGPEVYASFDPSGLRDRLRALPQQCRAAWRQSQAPLPADLTGDYDKVVIGGMGGSAIAGDLVADLAALQRTVPVVVARSFHLPFALDRRSLFISCSYSGNTRETLSLFRQAIADGAQVLAVTAGGTLAEEAKKNNIPILPVKAKGEPRSAVGYNLILLLGALNRLGLVSVSDDEAQAAVAGLDLQLSRIGEEVSTPDNPAKLLARELLDKLVVVYGGGIFSGVARRWKAQLNENAKAWAFYESIPESLHNSVEPYGVASAVGQDVMALVLQPETAETAETASDELKERCRVLAQMLSWGQVSHRVLPGTDGPPLAQLLNMILLGDYVSYYLALLQGLNPSPTPAIERSKDLAELSIRN